MNILYFNSHYGYTDHGLLMIKKLDKLFQSDCGDIAILDYWLPISSYRRSSYSSKHASISFTGLLNFMFTDSRRET